MKINVKEVFRFLRGLALVIWLIAVIMTCAFVWNDGSDVVCSITAAFGLVGTIYYTVKGIFIIRDEGIPDNGKDDK